MSRLSPRDPENSLWGGVAITAPVTWDDAADRVLGPDARAVRRHLCGERCEGLRALRPRWPHGEQGPRRRRGREDHLARGRRDVQRPRPPPLTRQKGKKPARA